MAEIEIGKVSKYGLKERVGTKEAMRTALKAYEERANQNPPCRD